MNINKREQQKRIREQKQQAAQKKSAAQKNLTRLVLVILVPLMVIGILYGLLGQGKTYPPDQIAASDHIKGNADGVKLVVYADFQCPACAAEHQMMAVAWPAIEDKAQLVFRHYPLTGSHRFAWTAALYAEAAGAQGKFWDMYDQLFVNQPYWSSLPSVEDEFDGYLEQLGLDVERAHRDMRDDAIIQKVRNDQRGGTRAGVRGTPTLFVDGRLTPVPQTPAALVSLVERARQ